MNNPEVSSRYSQRRNMSIIVAVIGGLLVGGAAVYFITAREFTEPRTTYVVNFTDAQLTRPEDRARFVAALDKSKVSFRRDLGIKNGTCDPNELPNYNVNDFPKGNCAQPDMGQQVTQRVGFNNLANLKEALRYVK